MARYAYSVILQFPDGKSRMSSCLADTLDEAMEHARSFFFKDMQQANLGKERELTDYIKSSSLLGHTRIDLTEAAPKQEVTYAVGEKPSSTEEQKERERKIEDYKNTLLLARDKFCKTKVEKALLEKIVTRIE